jgi:hypothetical protein
VPTRHPEEFCRKALEQENRETSSGPTNLKRTFLGVIWSGSGSHISLHHRRLAGWPQRREDLIQVARHR